MSERVNRWDRLRQREAARAADTDVGRVAALRDCLAADLRRLQGRLDGVEMALRALSEEQT